MAKNLKLNIKNAQIAEALNLGALKAKLAKPKDEVLESVETKEKSAKKDSASTDGLKTTAAKSSAEKVSKKELPKEPPKLLTPDAAKEDSKKEIAPEAPRIKARSKSVFSEQLSAEEKKAHSDSLQVGTFESENHKAPLPSIKDELPQEKTAEELRRNLFGDIGEIPQVQAEALPTTQFSQAHSEENLGTKEPAEKQETQSETKQTPKAAAETKAETKAPLTNMIRPQSAEAPASKPAFSKPPFNKTESSGTSSYNRPQGNRSPSPFKPREQRPPYGQSRGPTRNGDGRYPDTRGQDERSSQQARTSGDRAPADRSQGKPLPYSLRKELSLPKRTNPIFTPELREPSVKLGPTGKHINDLIPPKPAPRSQQAQKTHERKSVTGDADISAKQPRQRSKDETTTAEESESSKKAKTAKPKEFKDFKPAKKGEQRAFDGRDRQGLSDSDEERGWRKKRSHKSRAIEEDTTIRPTELKVRIPIALKDLAQEMKLKASQLIQKLFSQGMIVTLNDILEDETTIQLLGHEFGCEITIDTAEEERIRITDKSIKDEIAESDPETMTMRAPVVTFMGHVDHGKTSLIDAIRKSNRAAGEAGAITQHIGAFRTSTAVGDIAILDTPGHEAFSAMRARGADVTDIIVLVVAGDEGIKQQTVEAIGQAKASGGIIVVAINKCDKPNFNVETVYRQLSEHELLPESWGGQTITVNCSAVTGEGISTLLEMLALQAEVLELKSNPAMRARGTVLESEMHKGMGAKATVLVQNGTLKLGDCLVFGQHWARIKTMRDEFSKNITEAGPSTPVEITGLSGVPEAGCEFIVVKNEREAREIAEVRTRDARQISMQQTKKLSMENLMQSASEGVKKVLNLVLRADVGGSLEALKTALQKIESKKVDLNIISTTVGEITESDVQLAAVSKAVILGFHTQVESHAETLIKQHGVKVRLHDIIYHAIDDVKELMLGMLDKIAIETDKGKVEVKATFKSSQHGVIAGCQVTEGLINRNHYVRVKRNGEQIFRGSVMSLKRLKEDVREVSKGLECGVLLNGFSDFMPGDILESFEVTYISQEL